MYYFDLAKRQTINQLEQMSADARRTDDRELVQQIEHILMLVIELQPPIVKSIYQNDPSR